jgi:GDPmannose 4,6-dehydratase
LLVQAYRKAGLATSNCILYNHESPRRPDTFVTRKITRGVARIARGLDSTITLGNLDAKRDWGWAPDYADAILRSATTTGDYIVATGRTHSVRDFVDTAFAAAGITDWVRHIVQDARFMRSSDAPVLCGDATHARESLGWIPSVEFNEIVRRMVTADLAILDGGSEDQR